MGGRLSKSGSLTLTTGDNNAAPQPPPLLAEQQKHERSGSEPSLRAFYVLPAGAGAGDCGGKRILVDEHAADAQLTPVSTSGITSTAWPSSSGSSGASCGGSDKRSHWCGCWPRALQSSGRKSTGRGNSIKATAHRGIMTTGNGACASATADSCNGAAATSGTYAKYDDERMLSPASPVDMQTSARSDRTDDSCDGTLDGKAHHRKRCACVNPRPANYCAPVHRTATARCANCGLLMAMPGDKSAAAATTSGSQRAAQHVSPTRGSPASAGLKLARYIADRLRKGVRRHSLRNRFDQRLLAQYDVCEVIGRGSFSTVYQAIHRTEGQRYAIKSTSVRADSVAAVDNELCILSRVSHPYVVRLREVFRNRRSLFAVLELARGGELYERIVRKGRFTEPETIWCCRMLLCGVAYLHSLGVTHRDLKPENLLFSEPGADGRLLITDFGLAHQGLGLPPDEELMADTCGTPEYIAPEVLMRFPYNNKVDLWAVGVITYILLSGLMPFDDTNRTRLYRQIIRGNYYFYPEYWNTVSEEGRCFVAWLLDIDSAARPSAETALRHPWLAASVRPRVVAANGMANAPAAIRKHLEQLAVQGDQMYSTTTLSSGTMLTPAGQPSAAVPTAENTPHRTRSVRSLARSDHRCRVDATEVARLVAADPELRAIVYDRRAKRWRRQKTGPQSAVDEPQRQHKSKHGAKLGAAQSHSQLPEQGGETTVTKHYGLV